MRQQISIFKWLFAYHKIHNIYYITTGDFTNIQIENSLNIHEEISLFWYHWKINEKEQVNFFYKCTLLIEK